MRLFTDIERLAASLALAAFAVVAGSVDCPARGRGRRIPQNACQCAWPWPATNSRHANCSHLPVERVGLSPTQKQDRARSGKLSAPDLGTLGSTQSDPVYVAGIQ